MPRAPALTEWTDSHGRRLTHDFFKFPGKFHPPLVESTIRRYGPKLVMDPMAGVGTVAVEAKVAGIPSISFDVDPVAVFFTRVKTTPIEPQILLDAWDKLHEKLAPRWRNQSEIEMRMFRDITPGTFKSQLRRFGATHLAGFTYWFRKYALVDYARIDHALNNGGLPGADRATRRFFMACLLSAVRRISLADPTPVSGLEKTAHMLEKIEEGYPIDVYTEFARRVDLNIERMTDLDYLLHERGTHETPVRAFHRDSVHAPKILRALKATPDLILFSPPYCNAIEYYRRHRLEYVLGRFLDPTEIGGYGRRFVGRFHIGKTPTDPPQLGYAPTDDILHNLSHTGRNRKAWQFATYFQEMTKRMTRFHNVLHPEGRLVLVVGDSTTDGQTVRTADTLAAMAEANGFEREARATYNIRNRVMQYPLRQGEQKIAQEHVVVLRKARTPHRRELAVPTSLSI